MTVDDILSDVFIESKVAVVAHSRWLQERSKADGAAPGSPRLSYLPPMNNYLGMYISRSVHASVSVREERNRQSDAYHLYETS